MSKQQQHTLTQGEILAKNYRIESVLGIGGFGITYRATDTRLDMAVAIKEYFPQIAYRDDKTRRVKPASQNIMEDYKMGLKRFIKEGQQLARFKHINIVRVLNSFEGNGTAYMVMDFEEGETLHQYVHRHRHPLSLETLINIFMPVMDGVRAAHQQEVLHLDIKPDNIFIRKDSTPCLIDFGGARHYTARHSRMVNQKNSFMVASDGYAPPEQYSEDNVQGPWTDIYAIGATIYYCFDKKIPPISTDRSYYFINEGLDPLPSAVSQYQERYPVSFLQLVDDCLSLSKKERPQTVKNLQDRLMQKIDPIPIPIPLPTTTKYVGFWKRFAAHIIDLLILFVLIVIALLGLTATGNELSSDIGKIADFTLSYILPPIAIILFWKYKKATPGKMAISAQVIDEKTGENLSFGQTIGRFFGYIISILPIGLGIIWIAFDEKKQGWHDKLAGSVVIEKNKS